MEQHHVIKNEICKAIPIKHILEALEMLEYGTDVSVMFKMLFITGCRMCEMDGMKRTDLYPLEDDDFVLYWRKGRNQKGEREERLPAFYIRELEYYWQRRGFPAEGRMFHVTENTFSRYFDGKIRPHLSEVWRYRVPIRTKSKRFAHHYWLQLRKLRKNGATLEFYRQWQHWNDAYIGLEMACKRYGHSSNKITLRHYIENLPPQELKQYGHLTPIQILSQAGQMSLRQF